MSSEVSEKDVDKMSERDLVERLAKLFNEVKQSSTLNLSRIKKIYTHINLASEGFKEIWSDWWRTEEVPPGLEVDLVFACEDSGSVIDKALLIAFEVKYFKERLKSPYSGLQQALSFGLLGFDCIGLWHIFSPKVDDEHIERHVKFVEELIKTFNLPIIYVATKIDKKEGFKFFYPNEFKLTYSGWSAQEKVKFFLYDLSNLCIQRKNPLPLLSGKIRNRRNVLKVILKIPT